MKRVPCHLLENGVLEYLQTNLLTEKHISMLIAQLREWQMQQNDGLREQMKGVESELAEARRKLDRLYDQIEEGSLTNVDLGPRIRERKEQIQQLEVTQRSLQATLDRPLPEEMSLAEIRYFIIETRKNLELMSPGEKKAFLQRFIEQIRLDDATAQQWQVTLKYKFPALDVSSAGNKVLGFTRYGRAFDTDKKLSREIRVYLYSFPQKLWTT